jgi:probable phosphoglycerate mutase
MELIYIRHGETNQNRDGVIQGQEVDGVLNENGIRQVEQTATRLPKDIDFIFSSPLKRASRTAEIINNRLGKKLYFRNELKEVSYGSLAGKTWDQIESETGEKDMQEKELSLVFDYRPYGGEAIEDVKVRLAKFIAGLKRDYTDKKILIVTHGCVIDTMHLLFPQKERPESQNASIHEFEL